MTVSFQLRKTEVARLIRVLNSVDKDLMKQMRADFRSEIRPYANELKDNIPGPSPLSGMSRGVRLARTRTPAGERSPYVWKKPNASIDIGSRSKGRRGRGAGRYGRTEPVLRIRFNDKRPYSAFSILETAREATNWRGENMLRGLEKKGYGPVGKGRRVIEQFYQKQPAMIGIAKRILSEYAKRVNVRLGSIGRNP